MFLSRPEKENLKKTLVAKLCREPEITKIVVFGSFLTDDNPQDIDVAVFQNSNRNYLPLALKYRKKTRAIARKIPLDILPIRPDMQDTAMLKAIARGEVIYEK